MFHVHLGLPLDQRQSHQILVEKLQMYGFCKLAIKWMESYLGNRKQIVEISGKMSSYQDINIDLNIANKLKEI